MSLELKLSLLLPPPRPVPVTTDRMMLGAATGWLSLSVVAAVVAAVVDPAGLWWLPLLGLGPAPLYYSVSRHWRDVSTAVSVVDGRATVRGQRHYPASLLSTFVAFAIVALWMAWTAGNSTALRAVGIGLTIVFVVPLPDLIRITAIRTGVTFDADSLHLRTFGHDVQLGWSDVLAVAMNVPGGTGSAVSVLLMRSADARAVRRHRFLFSFEARPAIGDGFSLNPFTLDEPWLVHAQLAILLQLDRHGRERYLRGVGADLMTGRLPVPQEVGRMSFRPLPELPRPPLEN